MGAVGVSMIAVGVGQADSDAMGAVVVTEGDAMIVGVVSEAVEVAVGVLDQAEVGEIDMGAQEAVGVVKDATTSVQGVDIAQAVLQVAAGVVLDRVALKEDADSKLHFTRIL